MLMKTRFWLFGILVSVLLPGFGVIPDARAQPLRFEVYTTEDGLTRNIGYDIAQTPEGFMWFATPNGLNRFDGYQIKTYKANAQQPFSLCGDHVTALLTDERGNLWIATPSGICIYQPVSNRFYRPSEIYNLPKKVDSLQASRFTKDAGNTLWILTTNQGLFSYQKNGNALRQYFKNQKTSEPLRSTALTEEGRICVSSMNDIYVFDGQQFNSLSIKALLPTESAPLYIREFAFTHGELWICSTFKGIFRLRMGPNPVLIEHINTHTQKWNLSRNAIECILKDKSDNLWIGSINDGLFQYDFKTGQLRQSQNSPSEAYSLPSNYVISLFEDQQGIIWAGLMGGGIAKYNREKSFFQTISLTNRPRLDGPGRDRPGQTWKVDGMTMGVYSDHDTTFYVGTLTGGMIRADRTFTKLTFYHNEPGKPNSLPFNRVDGFAKDNDGSIWVAGSGGLCLYNSRKKLSEAFTTFPYDEPGKYANFYSILSLRHQHSLLLSGSSGFSLFDLNTRRWTALADANGYTRNHHITARYLFEPNESAKFPKGTVFLCTEKTGLLLYNYLTGTFREFPAISALSGTIRYAQLVNNTIWLASDNGLIKLPINRAAPSPSAILFGEKAGLPDKVIYSLQADKTGNIWVGTSQGICKFDTTTNKFTCYGSSYGLGSTEFNTAATCVGQDGQLYFGGSNGITTFRPSDIQTHTFSPPALLTGIEVMNKEFPLPANSAFTKQIRLSYLENFITFHFAALNFFQTAKTTYSYKLDGVDRDWEYAGARNFATYTNLSPGTYTFLIRAENREGIRSEQTTSVLLSIIPPFWRTGWFYSLLIVSGLLALFALYKNQQVRLRLKTNLALEEGVRHQQEIVSQQKEAHLMQRISQMEMTALRSQMNPHFIFNCLNSIKSYALNNDTENVSLYLTRFSKLIRLVLENSKTERIKLSRELETLGLYLEMEKLRFGEQFDFGIHLADNLEPEFTEVPPMLIQPYVENAIWHGLMHKRGTGSVMITVTQPTENSIRVLVEDNGIGRAKANEIKSKTATQNKSFGMKITSERLNMYRQLYNIEAAVHIDDLFDSAGNPAGTRITLDIPV